MAISGVAVENWDMFPYFAPIPFQIFSKAEKKEKKKKNPESSVVSRGFLRWLSGKESAYNAGDVYSIPGSGTLEKEMETRSSILAWEILRTEEPSRLQSLVTKSWTQLSN